MDVGSTADGTSLKDLRHFNELNAFITQAEEALAASEVPVGCVFVRDGRIIAKARNRTNELRNVSLHYLLCNTPSFDLNRKHKSDL